MRRAQLATSSPASPLHEHPHVSLAHLIVEATGPVKGEGEGEGGAGAGAGAGAEAGAGAGGDQGGGVYAGQRAQLTHMERARGAAKQLLAKQRANLAAWGALAQLEALAGSLKVRLWLASSDARV